MTTPRIIRLAKLLLFLEKNQDKNKSFSVYFYPMSWTEENNRLKKEFTFSNFQEAFAFMTRVAFLAEAQNHHPNWSNVYNTVNIELTTHDQGNIITEKDRTLAQSIDKILIK